METIRDEKELRREKENESKNYDVIGTPINMLGHVEYIYIYCMKTPTQFRYTMKYLIQQVPHKGGMRCLKEQKGMCNILKSGCR